MVWISGVISRLCLFYEIVQIIVVFLVFIHFQ